MEDDKDQQRNLLLAISLTLLLFIGWGWFERAYLAPPPPPEQERFEEAETASPPAGAVPYEVAGETPAPAAASPAEEPFAVAVTPAAAPATPAQEHTIESPLLRATFSSRGATLRSALLLAFPSKAEGAEGPVELIPQPTAEPGLDDTADLHALDLLLADGRRLQDAPFDVQPYTPGDPAIDAAVDVLQRVFAAPAAPDPRLLRTQTENALRAAGVAPALAWALAATATDVPLSETGDLQAGWSDVANANAVALRRTHVLDYWLPLGADTTLHKLYFLSPDRYSIDLSVVLVNDAGGAAAVFGGDAGYALTWGPSLASGEHKGSQDVQEFAYLYQKSLKREGLTIGIRARVAGWLGFGPKLTIVPPIAAEEGAEWFALRRKYFMAAVRPMFAGARGEIVSLAEPKKGRIDLRVFAPPLQAEPGAVAAHRYVLCLGPIRRAELQAVGYDFDQALNFGFFDLFGKAMLSGLLFFNSFLHSYGLAIVLLTVLVRLGLYPLNQKSFQSMRAMSVLQPKIAEIRDRYKNDPQEMNKRTWELYRENNINPLGGCLPMVFQMPVFFALFNALRGAIELRGADFLWIIDLSEPDHLATLPGGFALNILPLLMIGAMVAQQKMTTPPANPNNDPNIEMQRKMATYMPLIFGVMFYGMPSGLTLYWLVSTLLGIGQQYYINKA